MIANIQLRVTTVVSIFLLAIASGAFAKGMPQPSASRSKAHVREYFIAAEQVEWDYAPSGLELMHGAEVPYPWGLHRRATKTRYVEYTDGTFSQRKPQPESLGILGLIMSRKTARAGDPVPSPATVCGVPSGLRKKRF
jgi:hypothetical protein